ncbi:hypothetical protein [Geothrix sp.]|jgi:hypothetical protein|uniref:hypothetical protein n=1 Tax=Geothrix sp. TaxID=1962974 RepID=UPI0025BA049F|nr:hypothetical protein [Geothrix sp.]
MHSGYGSNAFQSRIISEYIRIYIKDILYNPVLIQAPPEFLAEAIGVLILCSVHCMISEKIPQDLCILARLLRVTEKTVVRSWPFIRFEFEPIGETHYVHPRIEAERQEAMTLSEKRRRSAYGRWNPDTDPEGAPTTLEAELPCEKPRNPYSKHRRKQHQAIDLSNHPIAMEILSVWNSMANGTSGVISQGTARDLPGGIDAIVEEIGGLEQILEAIRRIPKLPFYLGSGPHGWRASLPWLFQKKSIANLLAQTLDTKPPIRSRDDLTDSDRALIDQFREGDSHGTEV